MQLCMQRETPSRLSRPRQCPARRTDITKIVTPAQKIIETDPHRQTWSVLRSRMRSEQL